VDEEPVPAILTRVICPDLTRLDDVVICDATPALMNHAPHAFAPTPTLTISTPLKHYNAASRRKYPANTPRCRTRNQEANSGCLGQFQQLRPTRQRARSSCRINVPRSYKNTYTSTVLIQTTSLAASFTACANSLVSSIILPIISLLPFISRNLDSKFAILQSGPNYNVSISNGYNTPKQAIDDGAVVLAYGDFLDKIIRFLAIALALWVIALAYSRGSGDNIVKKQVKCKFCRKYISEKAKRCVNCTSWVDGREDRG